MSPSIYDYEPGKEPGQAPVTPVDEMRAAEMNLTYERLRDEAKVRAREYVMARLPRDHIAPLIGKIDSDFPMVDTFVQPPVDAQAMVQAAALAPAQAAADAKAEELAGTATVQPVVETHPTDVQPAPEPAPAPPPPNP